MLDNINEEYFLENPKGRCLEKHVKNKFPELYNLVKNNPGIKFSEKLYLYFHPGVYVCEICGNPVKFKDFKHGYCQFCCQQCAQKDPNRLDKIKFTCLKRYGVTNPSQSETVKQKKKETSLQKFGVDNPLKSKEIMEKSKTTILKRYGVTNPSQSEVIKQKKKETLLRNFGVDNPLKSKEIIEKSKNTKKNKYNDENYNNRELARQTCKTRYGVENVFELSENFNKSLQSRLNNGAYQKVGQQNQLRAIARHEDVIGCKNGIYICKCPHPECDKCKEKQYEIGIGQYHGRKVYNIEPCTKIQPIGKFCKNTNIERFIEDILIEYNIPYEHNNRSILNGMELDFYIPSKGIAIECNGIFWHSDVFKKNNNYHYKKYINCLKQNIQLITIWEDQILNYPSRVRNILTSKLGIYNQRIYARKCIVKECTKKEANTILINHLQGPGAASIRYGLYYNDQLVSIMTFSKRRGCFGGKGQDNEYELVRYCVAPNTQVIGGASKLLKHFLIQHNPSILVSYSSNDISIGSLYKKMGFDKVSESNSYWYIDKKYQRHHRYVYRKSELVKRGFDKNKSESQLTKDLGLLKIWDSGQTKWVLQN